MSAVWVVETWVPNGSGAWLPIEPMTYRTDAWKRLRKHRGDWPHAKFRVVKYVPAPAKSKKGGRS